MSPVIARSTEIPLPPGPPRPPEVPPAPAPFPPPDVPVAPPPAVTRVAVPQVPMLPPRWEYKRLTLPADAQDIGEPELNALGQDGWELVGVVASPQSTQFYFKRERA